MSSAWAIASEGAATDTVIVELGVFGPGRKSRVSALDTAVLFHRSSSDITFWATGRIADFSSEALDDNDRRRIRATVNIDQRFDPPRSLQDLKFSLERVYRFAAPSRHFLGSYTSISEGDIRTVESGQVFGARTALGLLAETLPMVERLEFAENWIERKSRTYEEVAKDLLRHIRVRYGATAQLLEEIDEKSNALLLSGEPVSRLLLVGSNGREFDVGRMTRDAIAVASVLTGVDDTVFDQLIGMQDPAANRKRFGSSLRLDDVELLRILMVS